MKEHNIEIVNRIKKYNDNNNLQSIEIIENGDVIQIRTKDGEISSYATNADTEKYIEAIKLILGL